MPLRLLRRLCSLGVILIGACVNLPSTGQELLAGDTGERICGDSTVFLHEVGGDPVAREGMILSPDSLKWVWETIGTELRLRAAIDRRLLIREAVMTTRVATDSLLKIWTSETARLEIAGDTALYAVGDKEAHVQRGPIARDAAVMMAPSAVFDEILIRRALMTGRDSVEFPAYYLSANYTPTAQVRFIRPDSVRIGFENDQFVTVVKVDSVGRILSGHYRMQGDTVVSIRRMRCSK
jgi:hypothetical protein